MKRIAVITSGGDAPGMNACLRAVVRSAIFNKLEVFGIQRGYEGLIYGEIFQMNARTVSGIINHGGTILKTVRSKKFRTVTGRRRAAEVLKRYSIDGLVVIGGDGSSKAALNFYKTYKMPIVTIPASIDNDVPGTDYTIGFDTAVNTALDAVDRIRDTATSHERVFIVEVMGRDCGAIALEVGIASGAEHILIPEIKYDFKKLCANLCSEYQKGKLSSIIIMAEGAGKGFELAQRIHQCTGFEVRVSVTGYIQRGGNPTYMSRILASRFGSMAVKTIMKMKKETQPKIVGIRGGKIVVYDISYITKHKKTLDRDLYDLGNVLAI